eukprot:gene8920-28907_t
MTIAFGALMATSVVALDQFGVLLTAQGAGTEAGE